MSSGRGCWTKGIRTGPSLSSETRGLWPRCTADVAAVLLRTVPGMRRHRGCAPRDGLAGCHRRRQRSAGMGFSAFPRGSSSRSCSRCTMLMVARQAPRSTVPPIVLGADRGCTVASSRCSPWQTRRVERGHRRNDCCLPCHALRASVRWLLACCNPPSTPSSALRRARRRQAKARFSRTSADHRRRAAAAPSTGAGVSITAGVDRGSSRLRLSTSLNTAKIVDGPRTRVPASRSSGPDSSAPPSGWAPRGFLPVPRVPRPVTYRVRLC